MRYRYWLTLTLPMFITTAYSTETTSSEQEFEQKIEQAIVEFEQTPREYWSYQLSRYENEEGDITQSIERYTPAADIDNPWVLVSDNGGVPTAKEQEKFVKKKRKQAESKGSGGNFSLKLRELINLDELQLVTDEDNLIIMSFPVQLARLGDDAVGKLQGRLTYNQQEQFIEEIMIVNSAEFSPMFSASISELTLTFSFIKIDSAVLPYQHKMDMKGRFALFSEIDETSTDTYSDYQYAGKPDKSLSK
ncbi:hypothetical protein Ssed_2719 [Shewanella sediminis HAW-EB3]|uniref:Uncharacterized protein n=1 Tax=Shewanella sediminis (strain HAW-EB3) TaxID=425104 RepID=A8FWV3_SHESH|nr:hypothetical protein [Shewanella sediminis]ABV37326.1 hypothetical protein Ssed_2719 [Shewanella sediminis HAW-EB3]